ncbi:RNA 2',3'-cyclic phosphodiesterase [Alcaligenaceae bacterium]|nr:RNA 2',3'-cyclic phosphodiesterase [Alcaligenaceae bacterium]
MTAIVDSTPLQNTLPLRRLFFALWPSPDVVPDIMQCVRAAHQVCGGRMMQPDTLHMTLAFLGHTTQERTEELIQAVQTWTVETGPITLCRIGRFDRPEVVWVGPEPDQPAWLYRVYDRLWDQLSDLGWARPERPYRPHVSLLRHAGAVIDIPCQPISWVSGEAVLVASTPQSDSSYYQVLARVPAAS